MDFSKVWTSLILEFLVIVLCEGQFECPTKADCACSRGINGDFELLCPRGPGKNSLSINVQPSKYMTVQCKPQENTDLSLLSGLQVGMVNTFMLRLCPLPRVPFKELMVTAGILNVNTLLMQSHTNLSNTLTREHLSGLSHITQLNLASNSLTEIPEDLFQDTANLTWLDMKNNNLKLSKGIFRPIPKLEVLELGSNNMSYLEPGIFRNLTRLRLLNLWGNRLQNLSRSLFTDLNNLENLDLNSNGLVTLPPDIFADLGKLINLNLNANDFYALPQGLFLGTTSLEKVLIQSNRRTLHALPPAFLSNLTHLRDVYLADCNLAQIHENLFWGSTSLMNLFLQRNQLVTLPPYLLKDNSELQKINLGYNEISKIPDIFFNNQEKLTFLDLSNNRITSLSKNVFSHLRNLEKLYLQDNEIKNIASETFMVTSELRSVDLSNNKISVFHINYVGPSTSRHSLLQSAAKLESINLAKNNISEIYTDWQISMTNLQLLDLSYNNLTSLINEDLQFISGKLTMDVSFNNISVIRLEGAEDLAKSKFTTKDRHENNSVRVILKGNHLQCDCKAFYLIRFLKGELDPRVEYILDLDVTDLTCGGPKPFEGQMVRSLDPRLLMCELKEEKHCPQTCLCSFRPADNSLVVNCSQKNFTQLPATLPTSKLLLGVTNHTEIDLSGNHIKSLPKNFGAGYERLTVVNLRENNLTYINISVFSPNIEVLLLDSNNLTTIDTSSLRVLEKATRLRQISLRNNPWKCDCLARELLTFTHRKYKAVIDYDDITCESGHSFTNMTESDLCPLGLATDLGIGLSLIAVLGFLICVLFVLYYKYQREIKVWLYAQGLCLWFVTEEELDKDKIYDAFVSYSHQDESFIVEKLVPGLENSSPKYKLCLHYRDWIVGDFIPNQIARSVEESRRTIVVLSPNFIESVWGRMEFRAAHSKALSEGRARVIVILYGELGNTEQLDPELKAYLSMNTYVKWGDPWFWEKIRYAMPHPPNPSKAVPLISQSIKANGTEKLVNGSLENNGITTPPADVIIDPLKNLSNKLS